MKLFKNEKKLYRAILAAVILLFIVSNLFISLCTERWNLQFDTTDNRLYQLSEITESAAESLTGDTVIWVLEAEDDYPYVLKEMLRRYTLLTDRITVRYIDPYDNPVFMDTYLQKGIQLEKSDLLVSGSNGERHIGYSQLLSYSGDTFTGINLEQQVTSAILYVNADSHANILLTAGHNERPTSSLVNIFESSGFAVSTGAATEENIKGRDIVVVASPTRDFSVEEIGILSDYLNRGGKLMAFFEPGVNEYPNFSRLLEQWNLKLEDDVVFDAKNSVNGSAINVVPYYTTHEINSFFSSQQYFMVVSSSRSIEALDYAGDVNVTPVLVTSSQGYAKSSSGYDTTQQEDGDRTGNFILAAVAEKNDGCIFLAGSRYIYADDVMQTESYANSDFIAETVNYLSEARTAVSIPGKSLKEGLVAVTQKQEIALGIILILAIPATVLGAGISVCVRRRKL